MDNNCKLRIAMNDEAAVKKVINLTKLDKSETAHGIEVESNIRKTEYKIYLKDTEPNNNTDNDDKETSELDKEHNYEKTAPSPNNSCLDEPENADNDNNETWIVKILKRNSIKLRKSAEVDSTNRIEAKKDNHRTFGNYQKSQEMSDFEKAFGYKNKNEPVNIIRHVTYFEPDIGKSNKANEDDKDYNIKPDITNKNDLKAPGRSELRSLPEKYSIIEIPK
ncbi:15827_t:CDS:2 [Dentiscutata erythropus]|uniref:15827_t:CDS:1 n=1 Tax=Dentiscutata erythropus TaxID=1348616 RepID=A0A9N9P6I2_9GLOM|nr:15827_t:CDS:2 [Dentiscutata erythropus]